MTIFTFQKEGFVQVIDYDAETRFGYLHLYYSKPVLVLDSNYGQCNNVDYDLILKGKLN